MTLYFLYSPSCGHCSAMKPLVDELALRANAPLVIRRNVEISDNVIGYRPRGTPAFLLVEGGRVVANHEGTLTKKQLASFAVDGSVPGSVSGSKKKPKKKHAKVAAVDDTEENEDDNVDDNEEEAE